MLLRKLNFGLLSFYSYFTFIKNEKLHFSVICSFWCCLMKENWKSWKLLTWSLLVAKHFIDDQSECFNCLFCSWVSSVMTNGSALIVSVSFMGFVIGDQWQCFNCLFCSCVSSLMTNHSLLIVSVLFMGFVIDDQSQCFNCLCFVHVFRHHVVLIVFVLFMGFVVYQFKLSVYNI